MLKYYILFLGYVLTLVLSIAYLILVYGVGVTHLVPVSLLGLVGLIRFISILADKYHNYKHLRKVKRLLTEVDADDEDEIKMQLKRIAQAEWNCKH